MPLSLILEQNEHAALDDKATKVKYNDALMFGTNGAPSARRVLPGNQAWADLSYVAPCTLDEHLNDC